ncbi:hypothetical protein [Nocardia sp. CA-135398]|uniref:hypothetical protein n=1 Tax=Nocardia sp. CA-135398 TaxID=3239977 RepID=UPI003D97EE6B
MSEQKVTIRAQQQRTCEQPRTVDCAHDRAEGVPAMSQPASTTDPAKAYLATAESVIIAMPEGQIFINADVLATMRADVWPELPEPRRMGSMLLRLQRRGYVEKIGERSTRARSHGGVTSEWRRTNRGHETLESPNGDSSLKPSSQTE